MAKNGEIKEFTQPALEVAIAEQTPLEVAIVPAAEVIQVREVYFRTIVRGYVNERLIITDGKVIQHDVFSQKDSENWQKLLPENTLEGKTKREVGLTRGGWRKHSTMRLALGLDNDWNIISFR